MINVPCFKGHFEWNSQTNELELVSNKDSDGAERKRRSRAGFSVPYIQWPVHAKDKYSLGKSVPGHGIFSTSGNPGITARTAGKEARISPRFFMHKGKSTVTLHDVKAVALADLNKERLEGGSLVSRSFRFEKLKRPGIHSIGMSIESLASIRCNVSAKHTIIKLFKDLVYKSQFDSFLVTLVRYFKCFFEGLDLQKRPHKTSYLEPSKAELKAMEETKNRLKVTRRHLGQAYCILLLGIGMEKQHHMGCGKQRVSSTHRDLRMFEDIYSFCTALIFVTFRRRELEKIRYEVGDMLRSSTYNPAMRQKRRTPSDESLPFPRYVKDTKKPIGKRVEELLAVELPPITKLTPAEHRRQYGKRPAIMTAIHQRSTAIISLLPLPHERSNYLFKSSAERRKHRFKDREEGESAIDFTHLDIYNLEKIGIIGEPMDLFNPDNLLPKNMDNEDDADSTTSDSPAPQSASSFHPENVAAKNRPISRTTTEDSMRP